jgi:hypothetical protein
MNPKTGRIKIYFGLFWTKLLSSVLARSYQNDIGKKSRINVFTNSKCFRSNFLASHLYLRLLRRSNKIAKNREAAEEKID